MPETLPRLKPNPIPSVHPVPEHVVTGARQEMYERTKRGLGVPWMGVVGMAFAHYPHFYEILWSALEPIVTKSVFEETCQNLRAVVEAEAAYLNPPPIVPHLRSLGYEETEIDEIRACNEVFSAGNMPYILLASLARLLLEGQTWEAEAPVSTSPAVRPLHPRPVLMEAHHADPTISALYRDIRETLGLPIVNTDYRAFARWPSYFVHAWEDLSKTIGKSGYETQVEQIHLEAINLAKKLPNTTSLSAADLRAAAKRDASIAEVLDVVRLFQWLLPGLALNVAFLREQLVS